MLYPREGLAKNFLRCRLQAVLRPHRETERCLTSGIDELQIGPRRIAQHDLR